MEKFEEVFGEGEDVVYEENCCVYIYVRVQEDVAAAAIAVGGVQIAVFSEMAQ